MRRLLEGHHNGMSIVHTGKVRISRNSTAPKTGYCRHRVDHPGRTQFLFAFAQDGKELFVVGALALGAFTPGLKARSLRDKAMCERACR